MKIRKIRQKRKDSFCAVIQKMKRFSSEEEARRWAEQVDRILQAAAAGPALGMSAEEAVAQRYGNGAGSAA